MNDDGALPPSELRRREFLVAGAAAGLTLAGPVNYAAIARARAIPQARNAKFLHGVAAGFPTHKGVTLWTRLTGLKRTSKLTLEISTDKRFRKVVKRREVHAKKAGDFTVHERVRGLRPYEQYYYRFETKDESSMVGKFRTMPAPDSRQPLRIAFMSCQDYEAGYYNAHRALAKEDLDLYVFLGDYVYERRFYPGPEDRLDTLGANGDGNVQTLAEYREKYRMYQSDPDLQALQASHAFVNVWDDHEVEDNYAGDEQDSAEPNPNNENNGKPRRVPFDQRRRNGYRAFFEAMPRVRDKGEKNRIYGKVRLGALGELFLTDQRQYRDPQPCNDRLLVPCPADDAPGRAMLGAAQKAWFKSAVPASNATWKLWGSELMAMSLDLPRGQHVNRDGWDGYGAERREILEHFVASGVENLAALTGDIHTFFAGDLTTNGQQGGTPVGVEFVGGSMTSLGIPEALNQPPALLEAVGPSANPHIKFFDVRNRGFGIVEIDRDEMRGEFRICDALTRGATPQTSARFVVESGVPKLNVVG